MAGALSNAVKTTLCDRQTSGPLFTNLILGLGTADIVPDQTTTLAQLVEALWPGYVRQPIVQNWTPAILTTWNTGYSVTNLITFTNPGPLDTPNNYTWFFYDLTGSRLVRVGRFSSAVVILAGRTYQVSPFWEVTG